MSRRILIADLHPGRQSLSAALAQAYRDGAQAVGHQTRVSTLSDMAFDPDFGQSSFRNAPPLEPDLQAFRDDLTWAEHIVLICPMWWGGLPAKTKGLFDRTLLPGYAFDPRQRRMGLPKTLLSGRSGRFILTSDTPGWAFSLMYRSALRHQVQRQILSYVGIKPTGFTHFSPVEHSTPDIRARWLARTEALGTKAA
ncbi:NAD(P)H-dependent oxidoreductase [Tabrizicola aquatica]|uniref:NAD(P)H-dependent oxidoreductase n=1 Tax=Tabrizicola aquatica TaxID=909926 RepID=UPI000CD13B7C|nr:NAD(P)H-dependent oxidoreductase [Tabrizicola aquatica]